MTKPIYTFKTFKTYFTAKIPQYCRLFIFLKQIIKHKKTDKPLCFKEDYNFRPINFLFLFYKPHLTRMSLIPKPINIF